MGILTARIGCALSALTALALARPAIPAPGESLSPQPGPPAALGFGFSSRLWQSDEGLPNNWVRAIAQTPDGYLWVGTCDGLARFDGLHFTTYKPRNAPELPSANITALSVDPEGALWIGTYGGGLLRLRDGVFAHFGPTNGLPADELTAICPSRDGSLWIGSTEGLIRFEHGRFSSCRRKDGLLSEVVRAVCEDRSGAVWVATAEGLNCLRNGVLQAYTRTNGLPDNSLRGLWLDANGRLWIGSDTGVSWYEAGKFTTCTNAGTGLAGGFVQAFCRDRRGNLWVGAYSGVYLYRNGSFLPQLDGEGVPFDMANALLEDAEGDLWVASREGLIRLTPRRFLTYSRRQGLGHDNVMSVLEDRSTNVWVGTWGGGLNELPAGGPGAGFKTYTTHTGFPHDLVLSLRETRDGSLWAGADYDGGLVQLKQGQLTHYTWRDGLINAAVRVIHEDRAGDLWVGTSKGLSCLRDGRFIHQPPQEHFINRIVRAICEGHDGRLWFGTENGLSCWHDGQFTNYTTREGLSANAVLALYEDPVHDLWIGTVGGGLNRWHQGRFTAYTTRQGLFSDDVLAFLEDDYGCFWLSCIEGLSRVRKADLIALDRSPGGTVRAVSYGRPDGLSGAQFNGVACPAAWKGQDGRLWFSTTKGLVCVDAAIPVNERVPPLAIEQVVVNKHPFRLQPHSPRFDSPPLVLRCDRGDLEFHFTALSYPVPEKNRFQYMLDGVDTEWTDAGARRTADYHGLAPGNYRFLVKACNNDGGWNETPASVALVLLPRFWQTLWFRTLAGLALAGALAATVRHVSVRKLRRELAALERERAIERERARIAKDIHDDLGSRLTQITLLSHMAQKGPTHELAASARKVSATAEAMAQSLDEIVWAVNPEHDTLEGLVEYLSQTADDFLENTSIHLRLTLPEELPRRTVAAETRHQLFLAFKEAMNNVVRHASATALQIELSLMPGRFEIVIADNGVGFDVQAARAGGNGLRNMRRRLEAIGGEFEIASQPSQGTRIRMSIAL